MVALFVSQLGAVRYGSGLHMQNVKKPWREGHWHVCVPEIECRGATNGCSSKSALQHTILSFLVSSYLSAFASFRSVSCPAHLGTELTLTIIPVTHNLKGLRYCVYGLCVVIASLGLVCTFPWVMGCQPFMSNFNWDITMESCVNMDIFRWRKT